MRLLSCYVASFGKLKDFSYRFTDGLNVFKEENGWGKSTLTVFIKSMFYGLRSSSHNLETNERLKYKPWGTDGLFGGNIELEIGGKQFRIERYFGAKPADDTVKLFDLTSGREIDKTDDLGKRIFEIDEDGFMLTSYFSQSDFTPKTNSGINAKFNALSQTDGESDFDKAYKKLENKAKSFKALRGDGGVISKLKAERISIDTQIRQATLADQTASELKREIKDTELKIARAETKLSELSDRLTVAGKSEAISLKRNMLENALEERANARRLVVDCDKILTGNRPTDDELSACESCLNDYRDMLIKEQAVAETVRSMQQQGVSPKNGKKFSAIAIIASLLALCVGIGLLFINLIAGIAVGAVGLICLITCVISRFSPRKEGAQANLGDLIIAKQSELRGYAEIRAEYEKSLSGFMSRFNVDGLDFTQALSLIKEKTAQLNRIAAELDKINVKIDGLQNDKDLKNGLGKSNDLAVVNDEIKSLRAQYNEYLNEVAKKRAGVEYYENIAANLADLQSKLLEVSEKITQAENEYEIVKYAMQFMSEADENLKTKYRSPLEDSLNEYLSRIKNSSLERARIDVDLRVSVVEKGQSKDFNYYSKGYRGLLEICKRFALIEVLYTKEKPFIILDDPFTNLDDEKLNEMLDFIKVLSNDYQILYFVCHDSRKV